MNAFNKKAAQRIAAISLLLAIVTPPASADDRRDHDTARQALAAGEILPLRTVLERLERSHPGEVLEVELEEKSGRWVYKVKLLQPGAGMRKLRIDARHGTILEDRQRRTEDER
jgi:uncharacterized membrane protein YkoI